jgi:carbonic anhydrase
VRRAAPVKNIVSSPRFRFNDEANGDALTVTPAAFLPQQQSHYVYSGSFTTPPCAESLAWIVFAAQATAVESALAAVAARLGNRTNARRHPSAPPPLVPLRNPNHGLSFQKI